MPCRTGTFAYLHTQKPAFHAKSRLGRRAGACRESRALTRTGRRCPTSIESSTVACGYRRSVPSVWRRTAPAPSGAPEPEGRDPWAGPFELALFHELLVSGGGCERDRHPGVAIGIAAKMPQTR